MEQIGNYEWFDPKTGKRMVTGPDPDYIASLTQEPRWRKWWTRFWLTLLVVGAILAAMMLADPPSAKADNGVDCTTQAWPELLNWGQVRSICDSDLAPDGSWERARAFYTPAHYVPRRLSCYGSRYSSSCTEYGGYPVDTQVKSKEVYHVTVDTILPDEPGHIDG